MSQSRLKKWSGGIRYQADLSRRYHQSRAAFLGFWHTTIQVLIAVVSSSAFILLFVSEPGNIGGTAPLNSFAWLYPILVASIGLLAVFSAALGLGDKSGMHRGLQLMFSSILRAMEDHPLTQQEIEAIQSQLTMMESSEPSRHLFLVEFRCHNAIMQAYGFEPAKKIRLKFYHILYSQLANWGADGLKADAPLIWDDYAKSLSLPLAQSADKMPAQPRRVA
jgi:hypothetical protein